MKSNRFPVFSPERIMVSNRVYASKPGERNEVQPIRNSRSIIKTQPVMSHHHHKRCNPIERKDIGKKRFRQSRCLRTMEDSDNNQKFNRK